MALVEQKLNQVATELRDVAKVLVITGFDAGASEDDPSWSYAHAGS